MPQDLPSTFKTFDRYESLTDLPALCAYSARPLRKSLRVNTLKTSVDAMKEYAIKNSWILTQVPWCKEAFYVDRENREHAIGKDILHLLGHFYLQEAASMLPPSLLDAQPGDAILDMSAAPGSKTTQIASALQGRGVIVGNDVQEKRLWTLKSALHRLGVTNVLVTKKVGQWFSKHMAERFDRVLCDAPCTAEGTVRKDSDALRYTSDDNREKMSRLQYQLLEAAINATKPGGRIVYSTCTLTPEENEGVIAEILAKYPEQIEVVDPHTIPSLNGWDMKQAIDDSHRVQDHLRSIRNSQFAARNFPSLRLWPHTYDTEGFFACALHKLKPTRAVEPLDWIDLQEVKLPNGRRRDIEKELMKQFGTSFLTDTDALYERGDQVIITNTDVANFPLTVENYSLGLPFVKRLRDGRVVLNHEFATLRGASALKNTVEIDASTLEEMLDGKDVTCDPELHGQVIVMHNGVAVGHSLAKEGKLKNNIPRWVIAA